MIRRGSFGVPVGGGRHAVAVFAGARESEAVGIAADRISYVRPCEGVAA